MKLRLLIINISIAIIGFISLLIAPVSAQLATPTRLDIAQTNIAQTKQFCDGNGTIRTTIKANLRKEPNLDINSLYNPRKYLEIGEIREVTKMDSLCQFYQLITGEWIHRTVVTFTKKQITVTIQPTILPTPTSIGIWIEFNDETIFYCEFPCKIEINKELTNVK